MVEWAAPLALKVMILPSEAMVRYTGDCAVGPGPGAGADAVVIRAVAVVGLAPAALAGVRVEDLSPSEELERDFFAVAVAVVVVVDFDAGKEVVTLVGVVNGSLLGRVMAAALGRGTGAPTEVPYVFVVKLPALIPCRNADRLAAEDSMGHSCRVPRS